MKKRRAGCALRRRWRWVGSSEKVLNGFYQLLRIVDRFLEIGIGAGGREESLAVSGHCMSRGQKDRERPGRPLLEEPRQLDPINGPSLPVSPPERDIEQCQGDTALLHGGDDLLCVFGHETGIPSRALQGHAVELGDERMIFDNQNRL